VRAPWLALLLLASLGCSSALDVERARRIFARPQPPPAPALREDATVSLPAVDGLVAISGQLRDVPLRWEPVLTGDVAGYEVERAAAASGPFLRLAVVPGRFQTAYVDRSTDLGDDASHVYRVRAFDTKGRLSSRDGTVSEATTAPAPSAPLSFRAYSQLPREVALSWEPPSDPTVAGYQILRSPAASGEYIPVAHIDGRWSTTWVDRELGDLRVFYYRVASVNGAGGVGEPTDPARAVTKPEPLPPAGLHVVAQGLGRNVLGWKPNVEPDIVTYELRRRREGQDQPEVVAVLDGNATEAADAAVGAGESVRYSLVARDQDGLRSDPSDALEVVSRGYDLHATIADGRVHLRWDLPADAGLKSVRVMEIGTFHTRTLATVEGDGFVDAAAKAGHRYRYQVVGIRADGSEAPPSQVLQVTVPTEAVVSR
jgi:fibronectin type 3 domain-containing protein